MGVRGEIFSNKVILPNRTYFFNVKENRMGDLYLNIVESKNRDSGGFERQSVILFADDLQEFLKGFDESLRIMEKSVREKKQTGKTTVKREEGRDGRRRKGDSEEKKFTGSFGGKSAKTRGGDRRDKNGKPFTGESGKSFNKRSFERKPGNRQERSSERSFERGSERSFERKPGNRQERSFERSSERNTDRKPRDNKKVVIKRRSKKPDNRD